MEATRQHRTASSVAPPRRPARTRTEASDLSGRRTAGQPTLLSFALRLKNQNQFIQAKCMTRFPWSTILKVKCTIKAYFTVGL